MVLKERKSQFIERIRRFGEVTRDAQKDLFAAKGDNLLGNGCELHCDYLGSAARPGSDGGIGGGRDKNDGSANGWIGCRIAGQ